MGWMMSRLRRPLTFTSHYPCLVSIAAQTTKTTGNELKSVKLLDQMPNNILSMTGYLQCHSCAYIVR